MRNQYSILINTTDSFEDCWYPFFKLFSTYWPDFKQPIFLNTETKNFSWHGLNLTCSKVGIKSEKKVLTWSECLLHCLDKIKSDIILYLQEDYFFNDFVNVELLNEFYDKFVKLNYDCLHLTDQSTAGPFRQTSDDMIWKIEKNAPCRISCQAAFWKKNVLLSYLRQHESAWQFEHYGTRRSRKRNDKLCIINTDMFGCGKKEIVPYIFTGIIKGRWNKRVQSLFLQHGIKIDFEARGFYNHSKLSKSIFQKIQNIKLSRIKQQFLSEIDLCLR